MESEKAKFSVDLGNTGYVLAMYRMAITSLVFATMDLCFKIGQVGSLLSARTCTSIPCE